jgi:two-component system, OmpR family, response regulator
MPAHSGIVKKLSEQDLFTRAAVADSAPLEPVYDSASREKRRILIVDDDANSTHLVKILLERSGPYVVFEENDSTKADQTAHEFRPDVILLDIIMPKMDGGELAAQIESDRQLHNTPIIFLTALVTHGEVKSGLHIQGHPLVAKPISIPELVEAIEKHFPVPTDTSGSRSPGTSTATS